MAAEKLPAFPVRHPRAFASPEQYLDWLCRRQLKGLYPLVTQGMEDRLGYELKAIGSVGLASWLLLLRELATACPVRSTALCAVGAAPGSLACRCLGLSEVDPYRHGLLFERFINPATPVHMHADAAASAVPGLLEYAVNVYGDQWGWSVSREGDEAVWAVAPNVTVRACRQLDALALAEQNARRPGFCTRPVR